MNKILALASVVIRELYRRKDFYVLFVLTGLIIGIAVGSAVSGAVIDRVGARQGYWVAVLAAAAAFLMALGTRAFLVRRELANLR